MSRAGAGVLCFAQTTGRFLLLRRSPRVAQPGLWSVPAGRIDKGETPLDAAIREFAEEAGFVGPYVLTQRWDTPDFHCFVAQCPIQFRPQLNWESDGAKWCTPATLPSPLHPGLKGLLGAMRLLIPQSAYR